VDDNFDLSLYIAPRPVNLDRSTPLPQGRATDNSIQILEHAGLLLTMKYQKGIEKLRETKLVHHNWYRSTYPDVAALRMASTEHYLRFGAELGRKPNKRFDTKFYVDKYLDGDPNRENPILHYWRYRHANPRVRAANAERADLAEFDSIRYRLLSLGFTEPAIDDLRRIGTQSSSPIARVTALRQIALWQMHDRTPQGLSDALKTIADARQTTDDLEFLGTLTATEMMCHYLLGETDAARNIYEQAALRGEINSDALLIRANLEADPGARLAIINAVLEHHDIPPIMVAPSTAGDKELPIYDRLTSAVELPAVTDGPLVTVLIAAYNAADTIGTSLRSLLEQSWKNLQIIVIDDCSPDNTCEVVESYARLDPRITLVRMEENGGAYVARNRGLDLAQGKYVTLHDADDWSHPIKIEFQVRYMEEHPDIKGSTTQQARATSDLLFQRWSGAMHCLKINVSSFMFHREEMRELFGYWDTVRFAADSELIRRMRQTFGWDSIATIKTGPLSFQRDSESSIVADSVMGMQGFYYGVRQEYYDSQVHHHSRTDSFKYDGNARKRGFFAPPPMRVDRKSLPQTPHYDIIIASDFRMGGGSLNSCIEEIKASVAAGLKVGIVWMFRYDLGGKKKYTALPEARDLIDGENVHVLSYGETTTCDLLIIRYPPVLQYIQRYVPDIRAKDIRFIVNQPPFSDYGANGVPRYSIATCAENLQKMFGKEATWHPIGPNIRNALLKYHSDELELANVKLSDHDWVNIIDVQAWARDEHVVDGGRPLRIGRHSRDSHLKWPETREKIMAIYPESQDIEVHILGGIQSLKEILPKKPENWTVHEFGAMEPAAFLAGLDVFIYFHHVDWVESFGRTIFEAMAVGVPAILPEDYRPVFEDAALYATPETAIDIARAICADPVRYREQVSRARTFVATRYGYQMHLDRFTSIKDAA